MDLNIFGFCGSNHFPSFGQNFFACHIQYMHIAIYSKIYNEQICMDILSL